MDKTTVLKLRKIAGIVGDVKSFFTGVPSGAETNNKLTYGNFDYLKAVRRTAFFF